MKILNSYNLEKIKNKQWYHQRFDGCPMFINFIAEAERKAEKRKPSGTQADLGICFYEYGKADWHLDMKDVRRGAAGVIVLAKKDRDASKKLLAAWKSDEKKFDQFFYQEFPKINLKKLSDEKLKALWRRYHVLAINRLSSTSIIDHFALGTDELIGRMIRKELKAHHKSESEFTQLFSALTAPVHQSFINLAEIELLKIITGQSKETLKSYQKRYFWSKNNYFIAQELSVKHFEKEVSVWKHSGKNLKVELERIEQTPVKNKAAKAKLLKELKVSALLRNLIKVSEDFTWWQDERKRATYFNIHMGCKLLTEIGRRLNLTLEELKYATASEVDEIFASRLPTKAQLQKRMRGAAFIADRTGYYIATGPDIAQIKKIVLGKTDFSQIRDFRGLSASTGKARGPVKIVKSATEVGKVKVGDILVAVMTRPDYVVAMKKAAAIVTNEGGITSHAAIVSRELGIPCIIGTKIATEVLKDGDMVEVNANHGWVRKI